MINNYRKYLNEIKEIGRRLRKAREDLNLSTLDVERECGIHRNTILRIERGQNSAQIDTILALLDVYELPLSFLDPTQDKDDYS